VLTLGALAVLALLAADAGGAAPFVGASPLPPLHPKATKVAIETTALA
jgi:hypothetical protein